MHKYHQLVKIAPARFGLGAFFEDHYKVYKRLRDCLKIIYLFD